MEEGGGTIYSKPWLPETSFSGQNAPKYIIADTEANLGAIPYQLLLHPGEKSRNLIGRERSRAGKLKLEFPCDKTISLRTEQFAPMTHHHGVSAQFIVWL